MRLCSRCFIYLLRGGWCCCVTHCKHVYQMPFTAGLHTLRACFCFCFAFLLMLMLMLMLVVMTMVAMVALLRIAVRLVRHAFPPLCIGYGRLGNHPLPSIQRQRSTPSGCCGWSECSGCSGCQGTLQGSLSSQGYVKEARDICRHLRVTALRVRVRARVLCCVPHYRTMAVLWF